jgi:hypothetical protein
MPRVSPSLDFAQLPDEAQSLICSLASTPSCPAHLRLSLVSKSWADIATNHLEQDGASITLQLPPDQDSAHQVQSQVERLKGLAAWLWRYGDLVTSLSVWKPDGILEGRNTAVLEVLACLFTAGGQHGGLRLQQLRLPLMGVIKPAGLCQTLVCCRHLRELQLDCRKDIEDPPFVPGYVSRDICTVLQQLSQLTSLKFEHPFLRCVEEDIDLDDFFTHLPTSLLDLDFSTGGAFMTYTTASLCTSSLQHLVNLKRLRLQTVSITMHIVDSPPTAGDPLAALTALTCLE